VTLNGTVIVDQDLDKLDLTEVEKVPKGMTRKSGFIGLAGHNDIVSIRNIRIKTL